MGDKKETRDVTDWKPFAQADAFDFLRKVLEIYLL